MTIEPARWTLVIGGVAAATLLWGCGRSSEQEVDVGGASPTVLQPKTSDPSPAVSDKEAEKQRLATTIPTTVVIQWPKVGVIEGGDARAPSSSFLPNCMAFYRDHDTAYTVYVGNAGRDNLSAGAILLFASDYKTGVDAHSQRVVLPPGVGALDCGELSATGELTLKDAQTAAVHKFGIVSGVFTP
jgi:hypothetical protein